jgi:hypothetical protein
MLLSVSIVPTRGCKAVQSSIEILQFFKVTNGLRLQRERALLTARSLLVVCYFFAFIFHPESGSSTFFRNVCTLVT